MDSCTDEGLPMSPEQKRQWCETIMEMAAAPNNWLSEIQPRLLEIQHKVTGDPTRAPGMPNSPIIKRTRRKQHGQRIY